jgi:hypothetical protein
MYVEMRIPAKQTHRFPIIMVHGGTRTGTTYTGTPDGRESWAQYFARRGYAVYVVDQPGRGRSGYSTEAYGPQTLADGESGQRRYLRHEKILLWPQAHLHTQWPGSGAPDDPVTLQMTGSYAHLQSRKKAAIMRSAQCDRLLRRPQLSRAPKSKQHDIPIEALGDAERFRRSRSQMLTPMCGVHPVAVLFERCPGCVERLPQVRSRKASIEFKNRVEQDLGTGSAVLRGGRFRLIVTDAIQAGDEDHGGRRNASNIGGIVSGTGY